MNSYGIALQTLKQWNYCWYFDVSLFVCLFFWFWGFVFYFHCWKGQKQSFEIWYDVLPLPWNKQPHSFNRCPLIHPSPKTFEVR